VAVGGYTIDDISVNYNYADNGRISESDPGPTNTVKTFAFVGVYGNNSRWMWRRTVAFNISGTYKLTNPTVSSIAVDSTNARIAVMFSG